MLAKSAMTLLLLCGVIHMVGCGDDTGTTSNTGGSGGSGASGGSGGSGAAGGSGGAGGAGGATTTSASTSESTTSSSSTTTGTPTGCAGLGDTCSDCLFTSCNALYCTCFDNASCGSLVACSQACAPGDTACGQACFTNNQAGISNAALVGDCAATQCPACTGSAALGPCEKCLFTSCSAQMNKCLANADCNGLIQCVQDGGDAFGCAFEYPDGTDDAQAVSDCLDNNCSGQCG